MKLKHTCLIVTLMLFISSGLIAQESNLKNLKVSQNVGLPSETRSYDNSSFSKPEEIFPMPIDGFSTTSNPPFNDSWISPDIKIDSGQLVSIGFKQISLKFGPDHNMYAVVNKKAVVGQYTGKLNIYRSDNGGLNWNFVSSFQSPTLYFGQFSFLVENSSSTIEDSTRIIIYFTASGNANMISAALSTYSVRRDGSSPKAATLYIPSSGNKFFNPSAVSNGEYEAENTEFGVVFGEYDNTTELSKAIRFVKTNFIPTYTTVSLVDPGYPTFSDYFPSAGFKLGSTDSLYIAVERRASNDTLVRLIATPWNPTAVANTYFITNTPDNYEKPSLSILQTDANDNSTRKMMITCIKNIGNPVYFSSNDAGSNWIIDRPLGTSTQKDIKYAVCSSDPDTTGGGYFVAAYQDASFGTSDSVTIRRGTLDSMGNYDFKRNDLQASGFMSPSVAIYKYTPAGGTPQKRSAFLYAGLGPINTYYDQENLPTGIVNNNGIASQFKLSQNYPNPFNPSTKINFEIPSSASVRLVVYDMLGREISTLVDNNLNAGVYTADFKADGLSSGMYFYRITVENNSGRFQEVKKMILLK